MKIYTRQGDAGETALRFGTRVSKSAARVEAYGAVDEANAALGAALAALPQGKGEELRAILVRVQRELFDLGAELAIPAGGAGHAPPAREDVRVLPAHVTRLEAEIDALEQTLEPLRQFILPGGGAASAALHVARTVVRRAERRVVALASTEPVSPEIIRYLNRLSDHLFVCARSAASATGMEETRVEWPSRDT